VIRLKEKKEEKPAKRRKKRKTYKKVFPALMGKLPDPTYLVSRSVQP
jgi:hypothetical protein